MVGRFGATARCYAISQDGEGPGSRSAQQPTQQAFRGGGGAKVVPAELGADRHRHSGGARIDGSLEVRPLPSITGSGCPRSLRPLRAGGVFSLRPAAPCTVSAPRYRRGQTEFVPLFPVPPAGTPRSLSSAIYMVGLTLTMRVPPRCVAASRYVDLEREVVVDRYGLWSTTARPNPVVRHRDDDEVSVASTSTSVEGVRRTRSAVSSSSRDTRPVQEARKAGARGQREEEEGAHRSCSVAGPEAPRPEVSYRRRMSSIVRHGVIGRGNSGVVFAGERTVGEETLQVAAYPNP